MSFCPNCGHQTGVGAKFCEYCGTKLTAAVPTTAIPIDSGRVGNHTVMLVALGNCSIDTAASLLADVCGYSDEDALQLVSALPVPVAQKLTSAQAAYLAQALTEYGMDVSVYDGTNYRTVDTGLDTVYTSSGNLLAGAAAALGLIGAANRISRSMMRRYDYPFAFVGVRPPVYRRRKALVPPPPPPPRRALRRPAPPRPASALRPDPAPRPGMRPAPAPRPAPRPAAVRPARPVRPADGPLGGPGPRGPRGGRGGPMGGPGSHF